MDNTTDITTAILIDIRDAIGGVRDDIGGIRAELRETNRRIDNLIELSGGGLRDHEVRIRALEAAVREG